MSTTLQDHAIDPRLAGGFDCDVHAMPAGMHELLPYFDGHWADAITERAIPLPELASYPPGAPFTTRADWRPARGNDAAAIGAQVLDRWGLSGAIVNCLAGVQLPYSEDLGAALATATNRWVAAKLLDHDPRLHASILVAAQNPLLAAQEIERCAADRRFVQVMLLAAGDAPLGRRQFWPIYEAATRHDLPIGIHAGSAFRFPVTAVGWPSYHYEDYAAQAQAFHGQLASLICEGIFEKFPTLRVVLIESGVTWLPAFLWRMDKLWKGVRPEIPWVSRSPSELVRSHVRLTIQPFDAPDDPDIVARIIDHLRSDELLLSASDWPHWQFDGDAVLPPHLPDALVRKIMVDNPLKTYPRLQRTPRPQHTGRTAP